MNLALAQSACLLRHRRLLRGGQASTSLKHDLSRATNDLGTLLRSCDWIHSVVEPCPSFFEQPLFGQCLTEFPFDFEAAPDEATSTSHEQASPKSPRLRQKQAKPKPIQRGAVLSSRTARNSPTQDSVPGEAEISSTHSALSLPRRADPGLLQRKAGSVFRGEHFAPALSKQISGPPVTASALPVTPSSRPPSINRPNAISTHVWQRLVAARAANSWLRNRSLLSRSIVFDSPHASVEDRNATEAISKQAGDVSAMFEEQWTTRVDGVQAAPQVLLNLINGSKEHPASPARRARSDAANPASRPSSPATRE